ncbi:hypothetical protein [Winogradskyella aquimaris]|uniref:Uncharacterized protein n=1 Tax=Winogradskyella aquimaris TaxID=864074 RepID=A0ABU5EM53_9FLAO|nr:hypothetical protein [Winogradskyella aquimaris]MDY2585961.1 hypothetical protein [Winogradskyella aquimaris]
MNKFFTILAALILTATTFAQAPEKMSYQAVVRDSGNALVTDQTVGMQISVLQTTATGTAVYVETQTPTTNTNGLVSLEIGMGAVVSGDFSAIDWSAGPYFIKTETDPTGGTNYTITGTSELLSVPYALHAKTTSIPVSNVQTDQTLRQVSPSWVLGPTFDNITGFKAGSHVKISYLVPSRNNAQGSWGGLYIEPQVSFDNGSTWNSLGSCGYDGGVMIQQSAAIGSYTNTLLIDPQQTTDFDVRVRFYYRSYADVAFINGQNSINNTSGTAPIMSGTNGLQHFTKVIVEEVFQ